MGFNRTMVSPDGRLPAPSRAGDGFLAALLPTNFNTETDETITTAQLGGGAILQGLTLTSDVTYTLPTAALIVAEYPEMDIGDSYSFYVANNQAAAFDVIIGAGVGNTAVGTNNNLTIAPQSGKMFTLVKTAAATFDLY
jgi:hypothetical protein